jgi:hypothetical protein
MVDWQKANPKKKVVRVLIAGGSPWTNGCGDTALPDVVNGAGSSRFRTYVISLDWNATVLHEIATAGGTGTRAIHVDPHNDTRMDLFAAMRQIVDAEKGCDFLVPDGVLADHQHLDAKVSFPADAGAVVANFPLEDVANRQACDTAAWYINPGVPSRVSLCDDICSQVNKFSGQVKVTTHCDQVTTQ